MNKPVDAATLHRTAKFFMDSGQAETAEDALAILGGFGLSIQITPDVAATRNGQIALLTLVNLCRRTFLGGVEVVDCPSVPIITSLSTATELPQAVRELGGMTVNDTSPSRPIVTIGLVPADNARAAWRLTWDGWRGGVLAGANADAPTSEDALPLGPAVAAAVCAAELFSFFAKDHPMAGRRDVGISLWRPGANWRDADPGEPHLARLPSRLWLIGLGNLGQAYLWMLAALPYADGHQLELMLQDFDDMAESNDSTSLLASMDALGSRKTRWTADWLAERGFTNTFIEERRFGAWTQRQRHEPGVALCGVDNGPARAALEAAGFDLVVESGLGSGTQAFRSFAMHCFPGPRTSMQLWGRADTTAPDVSTQPAYEAMRKAGMDRCGLAQLASRTIGVPFVGLIAAGLVIAELLRRLHGAMANCVVAGSAASLEDVEAVASEFVPYAYGHIEVGASTCPAPK